MGSEMCIRDRSSLLFSLPFPSLTRHLPRASHTCTMIKLFSLKQEKEKQAASPGNEKKVGPGLIGRRRGGQGDMGGGGGGEGKGGKEVLPRSVARHATESLSQPARVQRVVPPMHGPLSPIHPVRSRNSAELASAWLIGHPSN